MSSMTTPLTASASALTTLNIRENNATTEKKAIAKSTLLSKVWEIAKKILFVGAAVTLYLINPTLFAIGFIVGIVWCQQVKNVIDRIDRIWKDRTLEMTAIAGIAGFLQLTVPLAAASILFSAHMGSQLGLSAQKKIKESKVTTV